MHGTIDKDSPTVCDKVTLKTVRTWNMPRIQTVVTYCIKSPGVNSAICPHVDR